MPQHNTRITNNLQIAPAPHPPFFPFFFLGRMGLQGNCGGEIVLFSSAGRVNFHTFARCECIYDHLFIQNSNKFTPCLFSTLGERCWFGFVGGKQSLIHKMKQTVFSHLEKVLNGLIFPEKPIIIYFGKYVLNDCTLLVGNIFSLAPIPCSVCPFIGAARLDL